MKVLMILVAIFLATVIYATICWIVYAFHNRGLRSRGLFWTLICGAIASTLIWVFALISVIDSLI